MEEKKGVKPESVSGTRDLLPREAIAQQKVVATIQKVYERFGFVPLETPCLERWGVLTGNDPAFNKSLFRAQVVRGVEDYNLSTDELSADDTALRFDLTVSLARVVAAYPELPRPFKRYQIGRVFRGEQAQAGRFREFTQFDFDIIGSRSILADVEVVQVMYEAMRALGIANFLISFNTRKVLNGLAEAVSAKAKTKEMFRIIDKLDKIGLDGVIAELRREPDNAWDDSAVTLSAEQSSKVSEFLRIRGLDNAETMVRLRVFFAKQTGIGAEGVQELETLVEKLRQLGVPESNWAVDLSIARGLDYYTGPVFETRLTDYPEIGSVFSGGRFDGLANRFMPESNIAGVGASVGIDRVVIGMQKLNLLPTVASETTVLVTIFGSDQANESLSFAQTLRNNGISTELYLGEDSTLRAQFAYAAKQGIPYVVVIGPEEAVQGKVQFKDMRQRRQEQLTKEECIAKIKA